jgi:hypothetical protein
VANAIVIGSVGLRPNNMVEIRRDAAHAAGKPTSTRSYLTGEKLFKFVKRSEGDAASAAELPAFIARIQHIFTTLEIGEYLGDLERGKSSQSVQRWHSDPYLYTALRLARIRNSFNDRKPDRLLTLPAVSLWADSSKPTGLS